ncbi:S10 family peptidase [Novosphingobium sp. 11B]
MFSLLLILAASISSDEVDRFTARTPDDIALGEIVVTSVIREEDHDRPVLFAFNGGPGAGSAWLNLGVLGPKRVVVPPPNTSMPAVLDIVDNPDPIVATADLVLVDPLGTGFSRVNAGVLPGDVYDWRADGNYLARLIRDWLHRHHREQAPVYLIGESYGTERAVAVADALTTGPEVALRGIVLVSQSITVENTRQRPDNDLGTALGLPTIAASACHLRQRGHVTDPATCASRAYDWAVTTYLPALMKGRDLLPQQRREIGDHLAAITGIPASRFKRDGLTLTKEQYRREALRARGTVLGLYDIRYQAPARPNQPSQDPSIDALLPGMTVATRRHYREQYGLVGSPIDSTPYVLLDPSVEAAWRYGPKADPYEPLDMPGVLARSIRKHGARLMIAGGLFDTAGSYGADRYLASHLELAPKDVVLRSYEGGHMFYLGETARRAFTRDLKAFLKPGLPDAR